MQSLKETITQEKHDELIGYDEFHTPGYQYTIMYMSRTHSLAEFIFSKILAYQGKLFSDLEAFEVVEAFTIKTICDWEWYCERMICEFLKQDTSQLSNELGLTLPSTITTDECIGYLNGLGYFDLKSASNLKAIAKKVLPKKNNPFDNINAEARNRIDDYYVIRNYVAHKSQKSRRSLLKVYEKYNQKGFEEAGSFLLNKNDPKGKSIRFQEFGSAFWLAAFKLLESAYPKIYKWIVEDEPVYNDQCHIRFHYLRMLINREQPTEA
ncbi:hypothetical protein [Mucilaginibacter rubeus]|uniref:RiboL-PSP-HEPN domain-containing protein n=1 Tax=Mucilaginibacter rubeus TaxID=2027860 RepID=A0A5C1I3P5_9SPHI|nr:hypothetical protein [Mucilaginibacter rubeus]QEM12593.1 hypothetical protein DEO27_022120 [Mucilaginibacter rubeus]